MRVFWGMFRVHWALASVLLGAGGTAREAPGSSPQEWSEGSEAGSQGQPVGNFDTAPEVVDYIPGQSFATFECRKVRLCAGMANGGCVPQGLVCLPGSCQFYNEAMDGCRWKYVFECHGPSLHTCTILSLEEVGQNCGPKCKWLSFNQCACTCADLGIGTLEGGRYRQCSTH